jgi:hypothetical protein
LYDDFDDDEAVNTLYTSNSGMHNIADPIHERNARIEGRNCR